MKIRFIPIFGLFLALCVSALAGEQPSDAATRQKILGYWGNARHSYLLKSDGIMYMCPRDISTTTNRWDVKDGRFCLDSIPHDILVLTDKKFVYRATGAKPLTVTWARLTEKEAEGK